MKRSFSVPRLCAAAHNEFKYEVKDGVVYLADTFGGFGLFTKDTTLVDELNARGCTLSISDGLAKILTNMEIDGNEVEINDSGVTLTGSGLDGDKRVALYYNDEDVYAFRKKYFEIFKPDAVMKKKNHLGPALLLCADCIGIIMPIRPNGAFRMQCKIVADFNRSFK